MLGMSAFRRKPRQFNYDPRYYDAEKEAREERKRLILGEDYESAEDQAEEYTPGKYLRRARLNRMKSEAPSPNKGRTITLRLVIFIALLMLAGYYIMSFDGFAKMLGL